MNALELERPSRKADFRSIAGPHSARARTDTWLTPPGILRALPSCDLDPCAAPEPRPWPTAAHHYTAPEQDGLHLPWFGRVWLNPPYGRATARWLARLAEHGNGYALVFARTDTTMFQDYVFGRADGVLFITGRLTFYDATGRLARFNAGGPSCIAAYGLNNAMELSRAPIAGKYLSISR